MSEYLRHYVEWGLSDIFVTARTEKEQKSGYGLEITLETVVAFRDEELVEVVLQERKSFAPNAGGTSIGKHSERSITSDEYVAAALGGNILDSKDALMELAAEKASIESSYARHEELRKKRAPLLAELNKLIPDCPDCGRKMEHKKGRAGDFWGCPAYPRCGGTKNMTYQAKIIIAQLAEIV